MPGRQHLVDLPVLTAHIDPDPVQPQMPLQQQRYSRRHDHRRSIDGVAAHATPVLSRAARKPRTRANQNSYS